MFPPSWCSRAGLSSFSNSPRSCPYMGLRVPGNSSLFSKGSPSYLVFLTSARRSHPRGGPPRPADPKAGPWLLLLPSHSPRSTRICHHSGSFACLLLYSHVSHPPDIQPLSTESGFEHRFLQPQQFSFLIPSTPLQHQGSDGGSRTTPLWSPS